MTVFLQTAYRDALILRNLRICTVKNAEKLKEPDGIVYVDSQYSEGQTPRVSGLKLKLGIAYSHNDCGFIDPLNLKNWKESPLKPEIPFPPRTNISPSPHFEYLRIRNRLYKITLDRQWCLTNTIPGELHLTIAAELIRGPEIEKTELKGK